MSGPTGRSPYHHSSSISSSNRRSTGGGGGSSRRISLRNSLLGIDMSSSSSSSAIPSSSTTANANTTAASNMSPSSSTAIHASDFDFLHPQISPSFATNNNVTSSTNPTTISQLQQPRLSIGSTIPTTSSTMNLSSSSSSRNRMSTTSQSNHQTNPNLHLDSSSSWQLRSSSRLSIPSSSRQSTASTNASIPSSGVATSISQRLLSNPIKSLYSNTTNHDHNDDDNDTTDNYDTYDDDSDNRVLDNSIPQPLLSNRSSTSSKQQTHPTSMLDHDISTTTGNTPIHNNTFPSSSHNLMNDNTQQLRNLITSSLFSTQSTSSPESATFFASILYTTTKLPSDAYLYAQALFFNNERKRAVYILDQANLLSYNTSSTTTTTTARGRGENDDQEDDIIERNTVTFLHLCIESMILASTCLISLGEWEDACMILDDALQCPHVLQYYNSHHFLQPQQQQSATSQNNNILTNLLVSEHMHESSEIYLWAFVQYLKEVEQHHPHDLQKTLNLNRNFPLGNNSMSSSIHPIAKLCTLRGKAYDALSNPIRASYFLKMALKIDCKCVDAWYYIIKHNLLSWEEERDLIMGLNFKDCGMQMEWLRDVYFARVLSWGNSSNSSATNTVIPPKSSAAADDESHFSVHETPAVMKNGNLIDSSVKKWMNTPSSIKIASPATPQLSMMMEASSIRYEQTPSSPFSHSMRRNQANYDDDENMIDHLQHPQSPPKTKKSTNHLNPNAFIPNDNYEYEKAFQNLYKSHHLTNSPEILALAATRAYNLYNLPLALYYCRTLLEIDPLCTNATQIQIATLTALGYKRPLFRLAHALVDSDPKSAVAWYAVGCYYYTCGKFEISQRHFCRATRLDPRNAECWIGFGCAFASCDENDQANACFRAAQRLHAGSYYPMLYMGMEHLRTNNVPLAGHFLKIANKMGREDPLCCNELGVWAYRKRDWKKAAEWFLLALRHYVETNRGSKNCALWSDDDDDDERQESLLLSDWDCVELCQDAYWEPTIFNLGQSYRKSRRFDDAAMCFEKCLALCPEKSSSYSALGFTRHLMGDLDGAIDAYHQALSRKSDDPFASEMLNRALYEAMDNSPNMDSRFNSILGMEGGVKTKAPITTPFGTNGAVNLSATMSTIKLARDNQFGMSPMETSNFNLDDSDEQMS